MANIDKLWPFILSWEGGYAEHPKDPGGPTNRGVTLATWKVYGYDKDGDGDIDKQDVKLISEYDAVYVVMKPKFWDRWKADQILDQSIANIVVDWIWMSGFNKIKIVQSLLGLKPDGIVGPKTLAALNNGNHKSVFDKIWQRRMQFYYNLVAQDPSKRVFLNGWLNRLYSIGYGWLRDGRGKMLNF